MFLADLGDGRILISESESLSYWFTQFSISSRVNFDNIFLEHSFFKFASIIFYVFYNPCMKSFFFIPSNDFLSVLLNVYFNFYLF